MDKGTTCSTLPNPNTELFRGVRMVRVALTHTVIRVPRIEGYPLVNVAGSLRSLVTFSTEQLFRHILGTGDHVTPSGVFNQRIAGAVVDSVLGSRDINPASGFQFDAILSSVDGH